MVEVLARILASCEAVVAKKCLSRSSGGQLKWVGDL
jgi:hypothetical protein